MDKGRGGQSVHEVNAVPRGQVQHVDLHMQHYKVKFEAADHFTFISRLTIMRTSPAGGITPRVTLEHTGTTHKENARLEQQAYCQSLRTLGLPSTPSKWNDGDIVCSCGSHDSNHVIVAAWPYHHIGKPVK